MKAALLLTLLLLVVQSGISQIKKKRSSQHAYYQLVEGSLGSGAYRAVLHSDVDARWDKWSLRGYHFGFDPGVTPMYTVIDGIISTPYMIQVRGNPEERNRKRWGFHVFEGYARDDKSRITMLVNKHTENDKPVAEIYYYGTEYNHSEKAYNWLRIGSDVRQHSFLFSRDKAIFFGSLKLTNTITLGNLGRDNISVQRPDGDDEQNYAESARHVNYNALAESEDGTIFYDKDNHIVVIKINGEWMKLNLEPLPAGVTYDLR